MDSPTTTATNTTETQSESALTCVTAHLFFWVPTVFFLWLDLWSKKKSFTALSPDESYPLIDQLIEFRLSLNSGAVFGAFKGYVSLFVVASLVALGFVFYLFASSSRTHRSLHIALGLVLAGALGNLYDRAFIIADVAEITTASGQVRTFVGTIADDSSDLVVRIGDYPDGARPRTLKRSEISLRQQGVVRDFIHITPKFPDWFPVLAGVELWPWVFNVADASLVVGVSMLLLQSWFERKKHIAS